MKKQLFEFNIRSFIIVLFAAVGGRTAMDIIHLGLFILLPVFLMFYMSSPLMIVKKQIAPLIFLTILLLIALFRIPNIEIAWAHYSYAIWYTLWPIKAIILMVMVADTREVRWPMGNTLMFGILCMGLIVVGYVNEHGRLNSLFRPHTLVQVFGILLIISVVHFIINQRVSRWLLVGTASLALYGMILTASATVFLLLATIGAIALFTLPKRYFIVASILTIFLGYFFIDYVLSGSSTLPIFSRLNTKLTNMWDPRFAIWLEVLNHPFSVYGHSYNTFGTVSPSTISHMHSLFLELYAYYGLIGLVLFGVVLAALISSFPLLLKGDVLPLVLLVLFIGSMLGGYLAQNSYGVIGLAAGLLLQRYHCKEHRDLFTDFFTWKPGKAYFQNKK